MVELPPPSDLPPGGLPASAGASRPIEVTPSPVLAPSPSPSAAPVIEAIDVRKHFTRGSTTTQVLAGVNLHVPQGECAFLVGPSGCGKSTLLSILGCILSPDAGEIRILGKSLTRLGAEERGLLRRDQIGFVFQRFHLIRGLSALENVCVPLTLQGQSATRARRRGLELLDAVGLTREAHADTRKLSHGQSQRVALARALANDPAVILADEPTAALDQETGHQVMELLRKLLAEFQKTAVIVTHDNRIFPYADRILRLEEGILREVGPTGTDSPHAGANHSTNLLTAHER
jgi:putative ABC transport system ATP-binding protein